MPRSWLDAFFTSAPAGLVITDTELRYVRVNDTAAAINGRPIEDHLGRTVREVLPQIADAIEPVLRDVIATGKPRHGIEVTGETPAYPGVVRHWDVSWFPLRNAAGEVDGVGTVIVETTARKRAEERNRFQASLLDQVRNAVIATDVSGRITYWNRFAEQLYQWKSEEAVGRSILELTVPQMDKALASEIIEALAQGRVWEGEFRVQRKDGSTFPAHVIDSPLRNSQGELIGFVGISSDITDRKKAEAELRWSEQRLSALFRASPVAIGYSNLRTGRMIDINEQHTRLFGYSREELLGRDVRELGMWADPLRREEAFRLLAALGRVDNFEARFRRKSGEEFIGLLSMDQVSLGNEPMLVGLLLDVTARKTAENDLIESHAQMRALAARLTAVREEEARRIARELHDELGQQLTALKMEFLLTQSPEYPESASQRIQALVDRTIESVQKISGELRLGQLDRLGLAAAIEAELADFSRRTKMRCDRRGIQEIGEIDAASATALFRIFQEAVTNITRHASASAVTVRLSRSGAWVELEIADNGRGITAAEETDRTAIGLLGMRERTLAVGGEFRISGRPDRGTTIIVRVPAHNDSSHGLKV